MARIAVGGFHHETNCFVEPKTDFAYFAEHRDRPPLVRGPEVLEWLGNTSFALSGFLADMGDGARLRAARVDERRRRRHGHARCVRAHRRRDGRQALPADAGRCRSISTSTARRVTEDFEDAEGELLRRVRACVGIERADRRQPRLSRERHEADGRADRRARRLLDVSARRSRRDGTARRARDEDDARARAARRAGRCGGCRSSFRSTRSARWSIRRKAIIERSAQLERGDQVLNVSYLAGFPPADLEECGPAVIVHAYTQAKADALADELAARDRGARSRASPRRCSIPTKRCAKRCASRAARRSPS